MHMVGFRTALVSAILGVVVTGAMWGPVQAADDSSWVHEGTAPDGKWTVGFRAGMSILTQEVIDNSNTSIGPAINLQVTYGVNRWINFGSMLTWQRHSIDVQDPKADLASLNTITLLPVYMEFRPGHFGKLQPYASTGIGVNINSTSESDAVKRNGVTLSAGNTFAWRVAGGLDYPLTQHLLLNTEVAMNRNRGTVETKQGGVTDKGPFDASSINLLFGVKYVF
jgi:outer membrane protein